MISARPYGQRAVLKFGQYTGANYLAGRYTPGTFTNQIEKAFQEPRLLIITDPRTDSQVILSPHKYVYVHNFQIFLIPNGDLSFGSRSRNRHTSTFRLLLSATPTRLCASWTLLCRRTTKESSPSACFTGSLPARFSAFAP